MEKNKAKIDFGGRAKGCGSVEQLGGTLRNAGVRRRDAGKGGQAAAKGMGKVDGLGVAILSMVVGSWATMAVKASPRENICLAVDICQQAHSNVPMVLTCALFCGSSPLQSVCRCASHMHRAIIQAVTQRGDTPLRILSSGYTMRNAWFPWRYM